MSELKSILVYSPSWIGDSVMSLGALRAVRANYPTAHITVLARSSVRDLYQGCEVVDDTLSYEYKGQHRGPFGFFRLVRSLKQHRFDLALLFPNAFRAAAVARAAGIPERWGYGTDGRASLLTRAVPPAPRPFGRHQVFYYMDLVSGLGLPTNVPDNRLHLTPRMKEHARRLLSSGGGHGREMLIGIHPGATNSSAKRWIPERYGEVGERLARLKGARIVLLGGPEERAAKGIRSAIETSIMDLTGRTSLEELMGIIGSLSLLLSNDSGPMHLAAALGVPTVAVFGPTDERETGPLAPSSKVVRKHVECSPCLLKVCPTDHRCMLRVEVEEVVEAAIELLENRARPDVAKAVLW